MEIFIYDIPEEGLRITADTVSDAWFAVVMKDALGQSFAKGDRAKLDLTLMRSEEEIDIIGDLYLAWHPTCDRCLESFSERMKIPVHTHLAPLYESERQRDRERDQGFDAELVKEDLDFSYYEGDRIMLDEVIREFVILAQPVKRLCREDCKGLCQHCGKNLNNGPCGCREEPADARWNALKDFKTANR